MVKKYSGFIFYSDAARGYGRAHLLITTDEEHGINIGLAANEYQHSVYPDGEVEEILQFLDAQNTTAMNKFLNKYGDSSSCTIHNLWSWKKFKKGYQLFLENLYK